MAAFSNNSQTNLKNRILQMTLVYPALVSLQIILLVKSTEFSHTFGRQKS